MIYWGNLVLYVDGYCFYRVCITMGSNVLLGLYSNHLHGYSYSTCRERFTLLNLRGLCCV